MVVSEDPSRNTRTDAPDAPVQANVASLMPFVLLPVTDKVMVSAVGAATVTEPVVEPVAPSVSVTVSRTV